MFRRGTVLLLAIVLAWTLSDLFTSPAGELPDFNAAFLIIYIGLIALCLLRSPWGFIGALAVSVFRLVIELPIVTPIPEQGVFFGIAWSGPSSAIIIYVSRFTLHFLLTGFAYKGYATLQRLALD